MRTRSPEQKFEAILNALRNMQPDPSHSAFQELAAGALEDLLTAHGAEVIAAVELEARRNPAFNLLLGGVWQNAIPKEIWTRVQAARLKVW